MMGPRTEREQAIIDAIRTDALVGRGTCSSIDECYDDADLIRDFGGETTVSGAVRAARKAGERYLDRMMDCRFGDADDAEVKIMREYRAQKKAAGKVVVAKEFRIKKTKSWPTLPVTEDMEYAAARADREAGEG